MPVTLVPDPTWKGKGDGPNMVKADAMRKLYKAGESIGDIARRYGVRYAIAWAAINPPRKAFTDKGSTAPKPLTAERLGAMKRAQLERIALMESRLKVNGKLIVNPHYSESRTIAASDELDRRYGPRWLDEVAAEDAARMAKAPRR